MSAESERWGEVGTAVTERMRELGLSQVDLTRHSGVSAFSIRRLQSGVAANYRPPNLAKVCLALGWTADSIERLLEGREPLDAAATAPAAAALDTAATDRIEARLVAHLTAMEARLEARITAVEERVTDYSRQRDAGGS